MYRKNPCPRAGLSPSINLTPEWIQTVFFEPAADIGDDAKEIVMSDPHSNSGSPRPGFRAGKVNLEQLKKQGKELLEGFRVSESTAVAEVVSSSATPTLVTSLNDA